ncbi:dihydrodipicolinate synthase family protein [Alteribacter aurantiacus]|uniref:dihydrodipicolinate synthase family protein n=1 Tax=Alteribacter aurantiacus TaxID=254410 RepID=UPI00042746C6|nr:dihydrodipicolinate synthase family protein [Alteribacter aurantiacus]
MDQKQKRLMDGIVIPAHPLALTDDKEIDVRRQKALTRYYIDSGVGGIAVGVHTTQFEIRDPKHSLFEPVLKCVMDEINHYSNKDEMICIAGICGETDQAINEARIANALGYDYGLLSFGGLNHMTEEELLQHSRKVGEHIKIFGFYLQTSVGGRDLSYNFWREFAEIPSVHAIKVAPFNRYKTLDVVKAVCESSRHQEIALYTGNDDHIILDLLENYKFHINNQMISKRFSGGLLGQWAVWTRKAVDLLEEIKTYRNTQHIPISLLENNNNLTEANAAVFDAENDFKGCISGIHYVLKKQGLMENISCLNDEESLSPGQAAKLDKVMSTYPSLTDDAFVKENLNNWLKETI